MALKKKKKDLSFTKGEGRKERGGKKQKRREIWEEIEVGKKRQNGRNRRINDRAQSPPVLIIKWCLAHQSKCSVSDIIV